MLRKVLSVLAIVTAIALAVGVTLSGKVSAIFQHQQSTSQTSAAGSERKVLYWYDAMNPQHHYNKPGKAPDGMDLVPAVRRGEPHKSECDTHRRRAGNERFSIGMTR